MESMNELIVEGDDWEMELMEEHAAAALDESSSTTPRETSTNTPRFPDVETAEQDPWEEDPVGEMVGAVGDVVVGALEVISSPMTMVMGSCMLSSEDQPPIAVDDSEVKASSEATLTPPASVYPMYRPPRQNNMPTISPHLFLANTGPAVDIPIETVSPV
jgi:hypothetical protein